MPDAEPNSVPSQGRAGAPTMLNPEGRHGAGHSGVSFKGDPMDQQDAKWYDCLSESLPQPTPLVNTSPLGKPVQVQSQRRDNKRGYSTLHDVGPHTRVVNKRLRPRLCLTRAFSHQPHVCPHARALCFGAVVSKSDACQPSSSSSSAPLGRPPNLCSDPHGTALLGFPDDHG